MFKRGLPAQASPAPRPQVAEAHLPGPYSQLCLIGLAPSAEHLSEPPTLVYHCVPLPRVLVGQLLITPAREGSTSPAAGLVPTWLSTWALWWDRPALLQISCMTSGTFLSLCERPLLVWDIELIITILHFWYED